MNSQEQNSMLPMIGIILFCAFLITIFFLFILPSEKSQTQKIDCNILLNETVWKTSRTYNMTTSPELAVVLCNDYKIQQLKWFDYLPITFALLAAVIGGTVFASMKLIK